MIGTPKVDTVFVNGTVGTGKSTVAAALARRLEADGVPHALIDADAVRTLWPSPPGDPFCNDVELENLSALSMNYRRAGAERLVVAGVVGDGTTIRSYRDALWTTRMLVARLVVDPAVTATRISSRHDDDPDGRDWHLRRAPVLARILEAAAVDDVVIDATRSEPSEIAARIAEAAGW